MCLVNVSLYIKYGEKYGFQTSAIIIMNGWYIRLKSGTDYSHMHLLSAVISVPISI